MIRPLHGHLRIIQVDRRHPARDVRLPEVLAHRLQLLRIGSKQDRRVQRLIRCVEIPRRHHAIPGLQVRNLHRHAAALHDARVIGGHNPHRGAVLGLHRHRRAHNRRHHSLHMLHPGKFPPPRVISPRRLALRRLRPRHPSRAGHHHPHHHRRHHRSTQHRLLLRPSQSLRTETP